MDLFSSSEVLFLSFDGFYTEETASCLNKNPLFWKPYLLTRPRADGSIRVFRYDEIHKYNQRSERFISHITTAIHF
jgi:hypothetical protein